MTDHKDKSLFKISLGLLLFLTLSVYGYAQNLTGPSPVEVGSTHTYTYNDGIIRSASSWLIVGGTQVSSSVSGTTYTVVVNWTVVSNNSSVDFLDKKGNSLGTLPVTVGEVPVVITELNYIHNITPRIATTNIDNLGVSEKIEAISYFDGLGRPAQQVAIRAGGDSEDIVTYIGYDDYGRQVKDYLPYSSTTDIGSYRPDALAATHAYYDATKYEADFPSVALADINPYSEKEFDNSPLNRVMKQAAPGEDWKLGNGHEIEMDYQTNTSTDVRYYYVTLNKSVFSTVITYVPSLEMSGYYGANELYKTITKDENHDGTSTKDHTTEEFKTKQGQVVLKRTYNSGVKHDTYYVYDDYGNLTYVLPPKSEPHSAKPDATELSELCYQYKYDDLNRLVEKKIPGKDWESIVYNKLDQPVLTQDANLDSQNKWLFTKYDVFGRVAYTGLMSSSSSRITFQNSLNSQTVLYETKTTTPLTIDGTLVYYNNASYPTVNIVDVLTINYYDGYEFDKISGNAEVAYGVTPITDVKGLATGSKVRILDTNSWITTVTYYDEKARPIYVYSKNTYLNTTDKTKSQLTFDGRATETTTVHTKQDLSKITSVTTVDKFEYDHANRLVSHKQKVNDVALDEVIVSNTYDDLGQLVGKGVGGKQNVSTRLQDVDYTYNIRGWLKTINDPSAIGTDLFAFKLNYNTKDHNGHELFNGNISETEWRTANTDNSLKWYKYEYDALNRITSGIANSNNYSLSSVAYDKNGNITNLTRRGHTSLNSSGDVIGYGVMDELDYNYYPYSNVLKNVQELSGGNSTYGFKNGSTSSTEYTYDDNGNMLTDANKGITSNITYNHLNLPTQVTLTDGNIQYIYDATGVKQKKIVSTGTYTEYVGNLIYEDGSLKFMSHPEGYAQPIDERMVSARITGRIIGGNTIAKPLTVKPKFTYVYQYKDHLNNIRLSYSDSNNDGSVDASEIIEENNYYPFGLEHKGYNNVVNGTENNYQTYNGKEIEKALGLDWIDYGMRMYNPSLGRWNAIDPLAEKYFDYSGYHFVRNSPILFKDILGADIIDVNGVKADLTFNKDKSLTINNVSELDAETVELLINTVLESDIGLKTIKKLDKKGKKNQVIISDKAGVAKSEGKFGRIAGVTDTSGDSGYDSVITIFRTDGDFDINNASASDFDLIDFDTSGKTYTDEEKAELLDNIRNNFAGKESHKATRKAFEKIFTQKELEVLDKVKSAMINDPKIFGRVTTLIHEKVHATGNQSEVDAYKEEIKSFIKSNNNRN